MTSEATGPDIGLVASVMSAHHPFYVFQPGLGADALRVGDHAIFLDNWQKNLHAQNCRWYAGEQPSTPAAAFALQYLLGVIAAAGVFAAASGPWRARLDGSLWFTRGPHHVPETIGLTAISHDLSPLTVRLEGAHAAYLALAGPIAHSYQPIARLGRRQREAMVTDVWAMALRDAASLTGGSAAPVEREGCCFIYALPGCHECAGCPRLRTDPSREG